MGAVTVNLPKSRVAVFPARCIGCGAEGPDTTWRVCTHAIGWGTILHQGFGPRFCAEAPACRECRGRLRRGAAVRTRGELGVGLRWGRSRGMGARLAAGVLGQVVVLRVGLTRIPSSVRVGTGIPTSPGPDRILGDRGLRLPGRRVCGGVSEAQPGRCGLGGTVRCSGPRPRLGLQETHCSRGLTMGRMFVTGYQSTRMAA